MFPFFPLLSSRINEVGRVDGARQLGTAGGDAVGGGRVAGRWVVGLRLLPLGPFAAGPFAEGGHAAGWRRAGRLLVDGCCPVNSAPRAVTPLVVGGL